MSRITTLWALAALALVSALLVGAVVLRQVSASEAGTPGVRAGQQPVELVRAPSDVTGDAWQSDDRESGREDAGQGDDSRERVESSRQVGGEYEHQGDRYGEEHEEAESHD